MAPPASAEPAPKTSKSDKPSRPNYNLIHANPLPLKVHPLPPLIPHNPLSVVYFACTYLYQLVFPPSHPMPRIRGYFSLETRSVHVTDEHDIRALWGGGFFGKGSLSRSEPSWLDREKRRKGIIVGETSEEITRRRREERKEFKTERARKERDAIEEKLKEEQKRSANGLIYDPKDVDDSMQELVNITTNIRPGDEHAKGELNDTKSLVRESMDDHQTPKASLNHSSTSPAADADTIENQEHLQLTLEEAFFLTYGLGVLTITCPPLPDPIPNPNLLQLFRQYSFFPPISPATLRPDDPFLTSYVVYHHFRSLGWVVRPGIKFAVDYLLYNRGPAFSHAEFAIIILPSYRDSYWRGTEQRASDTRKREGKSWWWLHCVNRVQSQVRKSLVLVYVDIPPPPPDYQNGMVDVGRLLKSYRVRELAVKRWIPNRSRD
ncbi:hypothetical protein MMC30_003994 [Trapelia coarctata]|nr:hypothetical protein [Trapelia coarctata]